MWLRNMREAFQLKYGVLKQVGACFSANVMTDMQYAMECPSECPRAFATAYRCINLIDVPVCKIFTRRGTHLKGVVSCRITIINASMRKCRHGHNKSSDVDQLHGSGLSFQEPCAKLSKQSTKLACIENWTRENCIRLQENNQTVPHTHVARERPNMSSIISRYSHRERISARLARNFPPTLIWPAFGFAE